MSFRCSFRYRLLLILIISLYFSGLILYLNLFPTCSNTSNSEIDSLSNEPFIFIGGYPRSGNFLLTDYFNLIISIYLNFRNNIFSFSIIYV